MSKYRSQNAHWQHFRVPRLEVLEDRRVLSGLTSFQGLQIPHLNAGTSASAAAQAPLSESALGNTGLTVDGNVNVGVAGTGIVDGGMQVTLTTNPGNAGASGGGAILGGAETINVNLGLGNPFSASPAVAFGESVLGTAVGSNFALPWQSAVGATPFVGQVNLDDLAGLPGGDAFNLHLPLPMAELASVRGELLPGLFQVASTTKEHGRTQIDALVEDAAGEQGSPGLAPADSPTAVAEEWEPFIKEKGRAPDITGFAPQAEGLFSDIIPFDLGSVREAVRQVWDQGQAFVQSEKTGLYSWIVAGMVAVLAYEIAGLHMRRTLYGHGSSAGSAATGIWFPDPPGSQPPDMS